uniref:RING-type domain-containing protein n=1 Tax=viral metagenome TaxID=1070528 RepID=A0A6C0FBL6_9ZZZZ|tara:strand:- start:19134 stop:19481 length:348 start_codon:yes stop_codon:yes gene_type:complete
MIGFEGIGIVVMFAGLTMMRVFINEHYAFKEWYDMQKIKQVINKNAPQSNYKNGNEECTICLEELNNKIVRTLHCKHVFHKECIDKWVFTDHNSCPNCNGDIIRCEAFIDYESDI